MRMYNASWTGPKSESMKTWIPHGLKRLVHESSRTKNERKANSQEWLDSNYAMQLDPSFPLYVINPNVYEKVTINQPLSLCNGCGSSRISQSGYVFCTQCAARCCCRNILHPMLIPGQGMYLGCSKLTECEYFRRRLAAKTNGTCDHSLSQNKVFHFHPITDRSGIQWANNGCFELCSLCNTKLPCAEH